METLDKKNTKKETTKKLEKKDTESKNISTSHEVPSQQYCSDTKSNFKPSSTNTNFISVKF